MPVPAATLSRPLPQTAEVLQVRFFGPVRTLLQSDGCELPWAASESAEDFWTQLQHRFPAVASARAGVRLARNGEFLAADEPLQPGDEIALIPPVSGG